MAEQKRNEEIKYLNVCMDKSLHEEFERYCKNIGQSKTGATEKGIRMSMDTMKKALNM